MVIHDLKAVFVHVPKTAGTSIIHAFIKHVTGEDTTGMIGKLPDHIKYQFEIRNAQKHQMAKYYVKERHLTKQQWDNYYKFAFVRNPWERAVSEYCWRHQKTTRLPPVDFGQFLDYCEHRIKDKTNQSRDIYWTHAQPQWSYVSDGKKVILDTVYKYEHLAELEGPFADIRLALGLTMRQLPIPHYNVSRGKNSRHWRSYYKNPKHRAKIEQLYKRDIEHFGYDFETDIHPYT